MLVHSQLPIPSILDGSNMKSTITRLSLLFAAGMSHAVPITSLYDVGRVLNSNFHFDVAHHKPCKPLTIIYARGFDDVDTSSGAEIAPGFFSKLADYIGGDKLAIQTASGLDLPGASPPVLKDGDLSGAGNYLRGLIWTAVYACPNTNVVVAGWNEGAKKLHEVADHLDEISTEAISSVITFGDPWISRKFGRIPQEKILEVCNKQDETCNGGKKTSPATDNLYTSATEEAALFVVWRNQQLSNV